MVEFGLRQLGWEFDRVREGDKEVKANGDDVEKEKSTEFQREENDKIPIPEGAIVRKIGTGEQEAKKQEINTKHTYDKCSKRKDTKYFKNTRS